MIRWPIAGSSCRKWHLLPPGEIRVRLKGKFWEIIGRRGIYEGDPPVAEEPAYEPPARPWQASYADDDSRSEARR